MLISTRASKHWVWLIVALVALYLIHLLSPVLTPFVTAAMLAYLGNPMVRWLQGFKLHRILATTIVFVLMLLVIAGIVVLLIPLIEAQVSRLVRTLPKYVDWVKNTVIPWLEQYLAVEGGKFETDDIVKALQSHSGSIQDIISATLTKVSKSSFGIALWLTNLVLIPVVTFYFLRDWLIILKHIDNVLPRQQRSTILRLARESDQVLGGFIRGQLLVMVALGVIYAVGLAAMGLSVGPLIGMMAGLLSFVPYLGFIVGIGAAIIAVAVQFGDWLHFGLLALVFAIGQIMESYVLLPKLVGDKIGLHPVAVIFAVLAGGYLYGFVGILLALPVAAVLMVLLRYGYQRYRMSAIYDNRQHLELSDSSVDDMQTKSSSK